MWVDPPDENGDETLHIVSAQRALKLKGSFFREFQTLVVPLLDGTNSVEDIAAATEDVFRAEDLRQSLGVLAEHGIVVEGASPAPPAAARPAIRRAPQSNLLAELAPGLDIERELRASTVSVVGLGGAGAGIALGLAAAGVGNVRCVDWSPVTGADLYLSPYLAAERVGASRGAAVRELIAASTDVEVTTVDTSLETEQDIEVAVEGSHAVVCCLDASLSNVIYKLNRVCLAARRRWLFCGVSGAEIVVGPGIEPGRTACYMCYRMRSIACAGNPEEAFAYERYLDRRKQDDSGQRENLVFGVGLAANLAGLEMTKLLSGWAEPGLTGRILTVRLTDLSIRTHTVLRKPWCPACFEPAATDAS